MDPVQINNLQAGYDKEQRARVRWCEILDRVQEDLNLSRSMTNLHWSNWHQFYGAMLEGKVNPYQIHPISDLKGILNPYQIQANPLVSEPDTHYLPPASGRGPPASGRGPRILYRYTHVVVSQRTAAK